MFAVVIVSVNLNMPDPAAGIRTSNPDKDGSSQNSAVTVTLASGMVNLSGRSSLEAYFRYVVSPVASFLYLSEKSENPGAGAGTISISSPALAEVTVLPPDEADMLPFKADSQFIFCSLFKLTTLILI